MSRTKEKERPYVYIDDGDLDFRDIKNPKLPEGVIVCFACLGNGKKRHNYCDAPAMTGVCDSYCCGGSGFMFAETCRAVPLSVTNQIAEMNGLDQVMPWRGVSSYGLRWRKKSELKEVSCRGR